MKEIIDTILEEEKKAQAEIARAKQEARKIQSDAHAEASELVENARRNAASGADDLVKQAEQEAGKEREAALKTAEEENRALLAGVSLTEVADTIFQRVLGGK